jgi:hypothetical protein
VYVPLARLDNVGLELPLFHKYEYGEVPPVAEAIIEPVGISKQIIFVVFPLRDNGAAGCRIVIVVPAEQPFTSVTVTV